VPCTTRFFARLRRPQNDRVGAVQNDGVVVGEGDSYEEALADVKSAIKFHIETFGPEVANNG
jgi:hypothetical protein